MSYRVQKKYRQRVKTAKSYCEIKALKFLVINCITKLQFRTSYLWLVATAERTWQAVIVTWKLWGGLRSGKWQLSGLVAAAAGTTSGNLLVDWHALLDELTTGLRNTSHHHRLIDWVRLNVHQTHTIGHIRDGFLQVKWPNQQCQSTEGR